jgi:integrase
MRRGRVDGTPYPHGRRWRVRVVDADGKRRYPRSFATRELAEAYIKILKAELERAQASGDRTLDQAIDAYEQELKARGNRESSWKETPRRLRRFFPDFDTSLALLTKASCEERYTTLRETNIQKGKNPDGTPRMVPLAPDSHRNYLLEARSFLRWCHEEKGWLTENPLEGVRGQGKRRHGKKQPRLDEARRWKARALQLARGGDAGAVAAMMTMMMGLRASEITKRVVRDLDDDGQLLWIEDAKTEASNAPVEVPEELQPFLVRLAKDRAADELLFGRHWRDWPRENVQRICADVGIPSITAQGMRGMAATLAGLTRRGSLDEAARLLRHEDASTTERSYADRASMAAARRRAGLEVLDGGKVAGPKKAQ